MMPPVPSYSRRASAGWPDILHGFSLWVLLLFLAPCAANAPQNREAAWLQGVKLMGAGKVLEGIRLLDSLRTAGFDDSLFLSDYASHVFRTFVPQKMDSCVSFLQNASTRPVCDSAYPDRISWKVTKAVRSLYPCFQYGATFVYRKPYRLVFPGLVAWNTAQALLHFQTLQPPSPTQRVLANEFEDREDAAECNVYVDLDDTESPLTDYVARRINGEYDSIGFKSDLSQYHALSLRCYRRSYYAGKQGDFAAYIVFDRPLRDLLKGSGPTLRARPKSVHKIRFTVAVRSGIEIQVFAEEKLQSMLRAF
jgi:hypothetical protein